MIQWLKLFQLYILILILHCRHCRRDHFSLQNAEKHAILTLIFDKFSGGIAPESDHHTGEGLRCPSPGPTTRGHPDCQVLRAPRCLNPALKRNNNCLHSAHTASIEIYNGSVRFPCDNKAFSNSHSRRPEGWEWAYQIAKTMLARHLRIRMIVGVIWHLGWQATNEDEL